MAFFYSYHFVTALIIDGVIQQHDHAFGYTLNLPYIIAIVPTVMLAIFTRSLTVTILVGIFVIVCLRLIFNLWKSYQFIELTEKVS